MKLRKLLSALLVLCLMLTCLPMGVGAADTVASGKCGENATWKLDDQGVLTISGTGVVWGYTDQSMTDGWENYIFDIHSLVIGEGITALGNEFAMAMHQLTEVKLPKSLRVIGDYAFYGCRLYSMVLPEGVEELGENALPEGLHNLYFLGDAPQFDKNALRGLVKTMISYPDGNDTWTSDLMRQYGGRELLWAPDSAPLQVILQSGDMKAYYGSRVLEYVYAIGQDLRYCWQYRKGTSGNWIDLDDRDGVPELMFQASERWNGCQFRCKIQDGQGKTAYTNPVSFTTLYAEKAENALYDDYVLDDLVLGEDGVYRTPKGATVYIAVNNQDDGGIVYRLEGYTLYAYVESFGSDYFDMSCWKALKALMDEDGYVVLTKQSLQYLITTITGNPDWGEDESGVPYYLFYDRTDSSENPDDSDDTNDSNNPNDSDNSDGTVRRLAGENRWDTALLVAEEMRKQLGVQKFDAVIIASGNDFADALAGSYLSTVKNAPILLSWGKGGKFEYLDTGNMTYIMDHLKPGGTVYILGGKNAVPEMYEESLDDFRVKRLGGANRFETNLMILKEAGVKAGDEVLVCTSTNFADSLSASATGKPILLVFNESGKLYGEQPAYLASLQNCSFTVIGGESAVSKKLESAIGAYGRVSRLAGGNRFETSVLVAEKYFENPESAVLAYAWNYPDGLCGGALAYSMDAPLILTMTKYESQAIAYAEAEDIGQGIVLGGVSLISQLSVEKIFRNATVLPEDSEETDDPDTGDFPANEVYQKMIALKSQFPEGMSWTNDNRYAWKGGIFSAGYGCAGFAFALSDAAFGDLPARVILRNHDLLTFVNSNLVTKVDSISIEDVRVGDILRLYNDSHSVIILEVHSDYVVIAEGNYNSSIHWGRKLTAEDVAAADYIMTRYPE